MGTKLLYAKNAIANSPNYYFAVKQLYNLRDTLYKVGYSMDRIGELKSIESIKRTMLMHENIFKLQVKELHRLYNLQRKLMLELKNEMSKIDDPRVLLDKSMINNTSQNLSTWQQQSTREIGFNSVHLYGLTDDQQGERSGSCSGENSRILKPVRGLNLELPSDHQEGTSTSTICASYDHAKMRNIDEEADVELTLSIGPSNNKKSLKSHMHKEKEIKFSASAKLERGEECTDGSPARSSSSATFKQESASQAYWFFQDLSLNRR